MTQIVDREDDRPRVFVDYGYLSGDSTPLLVERDRRSGMTFAAAVSMKAGGDPHAARLLAKWIDGLGCQEVSVRTDDGQSKGELIRGVRELRAESTITVNEISPTGHSAANGITERAILTVGGLVTTKKAAIEKNVLGGRALAIVSQRCVEARLLGFCLRSSGYYCEPINYSTGKYFPEYNM